MNSDAKNFGRQVGAGAEKAADQAQTAARDTAQTVKDKASEISDQVAARAREVAERARDAASRASDSVVGFTRDNPVPALLIAAAAGAVIATLVTTLIRSRD